ncbi:MAG TPA: tetratricopeptide repeat protein, partial [Acidobacteriota bacterium]
LELDPEFVAAQVLLARLAEPARRRALLERLSQADLERLTPRERFMARYALALHHRIELKPQQILRDCLAQHPRDPYALEARSLQAWERQDWEAAERSYQRLLEIDPNWARAQNHLGYLAMARGRFEEAEDLFRTYLYIAPDQANPNDSMGELLTIRGRYDEAERALLQVHLAAALRRSGDRAGSAAVVAQIGRVNPKLAERYRHRSGAGSPSRRHRAPRLDRRSDPRSGAGCGAADLRPEPSPARRRAPDRFAVAALALAARRPLGSPLLSRNEGAGLEPAPREGQAPPLRLGS